MSIVFVGLLVVYMHAGKKRDEDDLSWVERRVGQVACARALITTTALANDRQNPRETKHDTGAGKKRVAKKLVACSDQTPFDMAIS